jgi:hypothetical protein
VRPAHILLIYLHHWNTDVRRRFSVKRWHSVHNIQSSTPFQHRDSFFSFLAITWGEGIGVTTLLFMTSQINPLTQELYPSAQRCLKRVFLLGILIFKGFTARRLYMSFGVKGLRKLAVLVPSWPRVQILLAVCQQHSIKFCSRTIIGAKPLRSTLEPEGVGRLIYWEPWLMCKGKLWRRASLSIGTPLGNLEGSLYTGDLKRWIKEGSRTGASLSEGALWREPVGNAPLLRTAKDMLSKALVMGDCFHRVPCFGGTWMDAPFLGPLREGINFFI